MKKCQNCGAESPDDAAFCDSCGDDHWIAVGAATAPKCPSCGEEVAADDAFCGSCGAQVKQPERKAAKTQFFGAMQETGRARLTLIRGGGFEGVSYHLNSSEHLTGRNEGFIIFPEDKYTSPKHCNFFYFGGKFFVSDEGSLNGVFIKIKGPVELQDNDIFRVGEQLFLFNLGATAARVPGLRTAEEGTQFFGTPPKKAFFRLTQILEGGFLGNAWISEKDKMVIGREQCDLNFPTDKFISGEHAKVSVSAGKNYLTDMGSRNGTYYRIKQEQELVNGDYVFVGQQLLRVEIFQ